MENWKRRRGFAKTSVALICAAIGLSACGGGKGGGEATSGLANQQGIHGGAGTAIKVEGQSTSLSSDLDTLNVVTPPVSWGAEGALPQGTISLTSRGYVASSLKEFAPGVYTQLPWSDRGLMLSTGTVTDIAGNGHFAIGRWTAGSEWGGSTYNANQGRVWAVGAPVAVSLPTTGMVCTLAAATRPTASDGNTVPGILKGATAALTHVNSSRGVAQSQAALTLHYAIGGDLDQTFTGDAPLGSMFASRTSRSTLYTTFLGPDPSKPYLVVSYGIHSPTVGLINGLAVLSCT